MELFFNIHGYPIQLIHPLTHLDYICIERGQLDLHFEILDSIFNGIKRVLFLIFILPYKRKIGCFDEGQLLSLSFFARRREYVFDSDHKTFGDRGRVCSRTGL